MRRPHLASQQKRRVVRPPDVLQLTRNPKCETSDCTCSPLLRYLVVLVTHLPQATHRCEVLLPALRATVGCPAMAHFGWVWIPYDHPCCPQASGKSEFKSCVMCAP